jgi:hypothetical protein
LGAIRKDGIDQFRVGFADLAKARPPVQIDPFLIARAVALVMKECTVRSAAGRPILWNDYRVVLARRDFDQIRALQALLERDLGSVLAQEAKTRDAELVGELRITVVFDEADELPVGEGVVRVGFVPTAKLPAPRAGEMTMRFDSFAVSGEIVGKADTVFVGDSTAAGYVLVWRGGSAPLALGQPVVVGRPHDGAPAQFVAVTGASTKVNKQQFSIMAGPTSVRIARLANANPVQVGDRPLAAGEELDVVPPAEISLSRGELVISLVARGVPSSSFDPRRGLVSPEAATTPPESGGPGGARAAEPPTGSRLGADRDAVSPDLTPRSPGPMAVLPRSPEVTSVGRDADASPESPGSAGHGASPSDNAEAVGPPRRRSEDTIPGIGPRKPER